VSEEDIVERCLALKRKEIYKTMTCHGNHRLWQDVYKSVEGAETLYIKLQIGADGKGVVVQFKLSDS